MKSAQRDKRGRLHKGLTDRARVGGYSTAIHERVLSTGVT